MVVSKILQEASIPDPSLHIWVKLVKILFALLKIKKSHLIDYQSAVVNPQSQNFKASTSHL